MIAQEVIVAKSQEIHQVVDEIVTVVGDAVRDHTPIHKVEGKALKILLQAGQKALQLLVDCLGNGDMGQEHQLPDGTTVKRSDEPEPRDYVSIFGKIDIERYVYAQRKGQVIEFAAIDARLALPAGKFSYLLQDWDQSFAMEEPFGQTARTVQRILGLNQYVDSLEHMNQEMAQSADMFQATLPVPPAKEEGEIFVQTADGKGVPIRRPADAPPIMDHQHRSGPKPDRKKMASLGAVTASTAWFARLRKWWSRCSVIPGNPARKPHVPIPATNRCGRCWTTSTCTVTRWTGGRRSLAGYASKWLCGMPAATSPSCASWTERRRSGK